MKYLRRWRSRSRAGQQRHRGSCTKSGGGPVPSGVTTPGTVVSPARRARPPREAAAIAASPSPLSTQSIAPSACSRSSCAMNDALCPPTQTKQSGQRRSCGAWRGRRSPGRWRGSCSEKATTSGCQLVEQSEEVARGSRPAGRSAGPRGRRAATACGHQLEPERLQAQVDLGIHAAGSDGRRGLAWQGDGLCCCSWQMPITLLPRASIANRTHAH